MQIITRLCPSCGTEKSIDQFVYYRGRAEHYFDCRSCETSRDRKRAAWKQTLDGREGNDPRAWLLERSLINAESAGIEHAIGIEDIPTPNLCKYLGVVLVYRTKADRETRRWGDALASLDRIDSSRGYVPGNVQVISYLANRMKQDATVEQLVAFAKGVLKHHS